MMDAQKALPLFVSHQLMVLPRPSNSMAPITWDATYRLRRLALVRTAKEATLEAIRGQKM